MNTNRNIHLTGTANLVSIVQPETNLLRARKVVTRSRARATGKFPSLKMNRMMQWESVNELNAFRLLEADPSVIRFSEQPFVIKYVMNGEEFYHYPDILFETTDTKHLWEVKPNAYASRPEVAARTALLRNQLPNHGYKYDLVLAEDLARKGRLHNIKKLLIHGRSRVSPLLREHIRQLFISKPNMTLGSIVNAPSIEVSVREIYRLILDGVLRCDLENPLTMESRLTHSDFGADQKD